MQIASETGGWLRMRPVRYEFESEPDGPREDWLTVEVAAAGRDGHTWQTEVPCLLVAEAIELAGWLHDEAGTGELEFIEPNVAFRRRHGGPGVELLEVTFAQETLPPWLPGSGRGRVHRIRMEVTSDHLVQAAGDWAAEIAAFPPRADLADW
ncbi:hypothetical protein ACWT_5346 [Actinoplanes sp. SE50]|uniref:WapI family immunity protein n=1 Tax=unclassified Actinoplanes TaxID=2626549 RepID=UPI00023EC312|nr:MULTISPECIES: hypothetical protein [unclassified Actinoplanes]AEV86364.1 hypothetical protein ACPL_5477 [Actinoplanes sp. SE50/110]ATO84761.1 hypothetical protein ACWT_5346 [Actinoplanes sp. SE50]SLM02171.1 hypothetical protein ACSP50_5409 [Actinoplanes sp. SE50/110]